ncbi:MAG: hypothetical protein LKG26_04310 [Saccharofermentans sp.]|jgi:hypothetical protein|nr:hypothetical protein [Mageeibacillus sp.]MCI1264775.1 hypothetical protein [Saccharofermentans sp.]MCI1275291.1 hypothetical protein [Saccharofermentans sp.]MCI1769685.1 hypothetical protein [Mageeibacillus sp.]MCI2044335.1 hypothetical protein [Mageeibacillus sp.]
MTLKEKILVIVTVVLVLAMIGGFIYDRNDFILNRTNLIDIAGDDNLTVVSMEKHGSLFYRVSYEAKLRVNDNYWEQYMYKITVAYGVEGGFLTSDEYSTYEQSVLSDVTVKPDPADGAIIWLAGSTLNSKDKQNVVYIIDQESDGNAYIYLYYSRN